MFYFFILEFVLEGYFDKVVDQIFDVLVDYFIVFDFQLKVVCEIFVIIGQVVLVGEVKFNVYLDVQQIVCDVINCIGYIKLEYMFEVNSCGVLFVIYEQLLDINQGVECQNFEDQGAGDQGMMFGYVIVEIENYMLLVFDFFYKILQELVDICKVGQEMIYLCLDSKLQVMIEYSDDYQLQCIDSIVVFIQYDFFDEDEVMLVQICKDVIEMVIFCVKV